MNGRPNVPGSGGVRAACALIAGALWLAPVVAQDTADTAPQEARPAITRTFVRLANGVPAVLYAPATPSGKSRIAVFAMHSNADYLEFSACTELAGRGYRVLCANNSLGKAGTFQEGQLDRIIGEAKLGVEYLRAQPGIQRIVLFGHSGGATLMSAYQMIAERGLASCRGPEKIHQCPDDLAGLPAADGMLLIDSNWGQATMSLLSTDPAVTSEQTGYGVDPSLDLFNPDNGFDPEGSRYAPAFVSRFQEAQGERVNRLIQEAQHRLERIDAGSGGYSDDEPMTIPGASLLGMNNKLFPQDPSLLSHTRNAWPLIRADGSVSEQIIRTVRAPRNVTSHTASMRGALATTVRGYLSTYAIRTTGEYRYGADGVQGIDWASTYAATPANVAHISVPLLTMGMTGGWEFLAAEAIHERAASSDKTIAFVEGADHLYRPCTQCVAPAEAYGDTVRLTYDFIDGWLSHPGRFD